MSVVVSTSGRINEDFLRLFFHDNREASVLTGELSEESVQFCFTRAVCLVNLKGSIGLMLNKVSDMRVGVVSIIVTQKSVWSNQIGHAT